MKKAWQEIARCVSQGGVHAKSGWKLSETTDEQRLQHLMDEVKELMDAPDDILEMADVAAILFHHVQARGFSMKRFEDAILFKLKKRIEFPKKRSRK